MNPGAPSLYLDPLLPLALYPGPRSIPAVAGATPARAIVIAESGGYSVGGDAGSRAAELHAPGLLWRRADERVRLRPLAGDSSTDDAEANAAGGRRGDARAGWLVVVGQQLLDQLIVGAYGEPGFSRFVEGFSNPGSSPSGPFLDDLDDLLAALVRELDERPPAWRVRARSLLTDALLSLYRSTLTADPAGDSTGGTDGFRMAALIDHIELNSADHLDLESLAAMMQTSPTHLSRVFRREVGVALFEYINRTRVRKACSLLRRTSLPVTRIAVDVGYNNVSFFNRYFRRIMRCSPRDYRRQVTE
ncbi:MAG: AraC family transcriptional regulator [Spirochaetaceae bacterium]|nr:MAG: AraC family transcriptional regulator [Spirochaetaceae bacterium]